tara:strand:+ start:603 stop:2774 length:2172 start_codon:yes stop_codon:yes gene_type:complete
MDTLQEPSNQEINQLNQAFNEGNSEKLLLLCTQLKKKYENSSYLNLFYGSYYYLKNDLIKSEGYLETSLELDGSNLGSLNLKGLVKTKLGKYTEAINCFNEILKINSKDINALNNLGNLYRKKGEHDDSLLLINKALEIDPENINLMINKTSSLISSGMFQEAKELSYNILQKTKNNSILLNNLGIINGYFNNYDEALDFFKQSNILEPQYIDPFINFIEVLIKINRSKFAIEIIEEKITFFEEPYKIYNLLSKLYDSTSQLERGIKFYESILNNNIRFKYLVLNHLGNIYRLSNHIDHAIKCYNESIELNNSFSISYSNLGASYFEKGDYKKAEKYYTKSIEINPNESTTYYNYGNLKNSQKHFEESREFYLKALEVNPNFYDAFYALVRNKEIKNNDLIFQQYLEIYQKQYLDDESKSTLAFAFAEYYENMKQFDKSFHFYKEANNFFRKSINFDITDRKNFFEKIKKLSKTKTKKNQINILKEISPIFIIGLPRCGSTLVEQILSSHSKVFGCGEVEFLKNEINKLGIDEDKKFPFSSSDFSNEKLDTVHSNYINKLLNLSNDHKFFTDKNLNNFIYVEIITRLFPDAKILHIRRDPLDHCFSIFSIRFAGYHPYSYKMDEIALYYNYYTDLMNYWKKNYSKNILDVFYEDIVNDTKQTVNHFLSFCNLSFEDNCLRFYENKRPVKTASIYQVRNKIYSSSVGRAKNFESELLNLKKIIK